MTRDSRTPTYSKLLDDLYERVGPERYEAVRVQVAELAKARTGAVANIRDRALRDYCRAAHTFDKYWSEAWVTACNEVLENKDE